MSVEALVLERDEGRCFRCGQAAREGFRNCHHRQLKGGGGPDTAENRITLCGSGTMGCHGHVHQHRAEAGLNGWIISRHVSHDGLEGIPALRWDGEFVHLMPDLRVLTVEQFAAERAASG